MVQSEWNMALDTLFRLSQGIHRCNDAQWRGDFVSWIKALYHFYGELSPWMSESSQTDLLQSLERCKNWQGYAFEDNLHYFFLTTQKLRREADKNKLLLKTKEDTSKHGG